MIRNIFAALILLVSACIPTSILAVQPEQIGLYEPPGQYFDIGGYKLHLYCEGQGSPTVLLESGLGGFSLDWFSVQAQLSRVTRVCSYDRAGYGWSQMGPAPRTVAQIADELEILLDKADILGPLVLVGHSFGGYGVQYFSKMNPERTLGMVLVESSHPQQSERLPDIPSHRDRSDSLDDVTVFFNPDTVLNYPQALRSVAHGILASRKTLFTQRREFLNFTYSGIQVDELGDLPDRPLSVITRGKRVWPNDPYGNTLERTWLEMQKEFLQSSHSATHVFANKSGHLVHMDEPELVVATIMDTISTICESNQPELTEVKSELSYCLQH